MSIICCNNVPKSWSLTFFVSTISNAIKGRYEANFEVLNFVMTKTAKRAYLRLSEKLDPLAVVERVNKSKFQGKKIVAYIPKDVPDLPLASQSHQKKLKAALAPPKPLDESKPWWGPELEKLRSQVRQKLNRAMNTSNTEDWDSYRAAKADYKKKIRYWSSNAWRNSTEEDISSKAKANQTIIVTHQEILIELQSKYTGLFDLSKKSDHKLMKEIAKTVFERLRDIIQSNLENAKTPFILSKAYRRSYPHFGDFQLILSTLHAAEDAAGAPRTQLQEQALAAPCKEFPVIGNIPYEKVQRTCQKFASKIEHKIIEHVNSMKVEPESDKPTPEELACSRVRTELKKIRPYIGPIIRQVVGISFVSPVVGPKRHVRMKIYGEPFLPTRDHLSPIFQKYQALRIVRSDKIFNSVSFAVMQMNYSALMAYDGKEIGGARLVVRKAETQHFKVPGDLVNQMRQSLSNPPDVPEPEMNDEDMEDWGDMVEL